MPSRLTRDVSIISIISTASDNLPEVHEISATLSVAPASGSVSPGLQEPKPIDSARDFSNAPISAGELQAVLMNLRDNADLASLKSVFERINAELNADLTVQVQREATMQINELRSQLEDIIREVRIVTLCNDCTNVMETAFSVTCQHLFCGPCLEKSFENQLRRRLQDAAHSKGLALDTFLPLPNDANGQRIIVERLIAHGLKMGINELLTYNCPIACCPAAIRSPPATCWKQRSIMRGISEAFQDVEGILPENWKMISEGGAATFIKFFPIKD